MNVMISINYKDCSKNTVYKDADGYHDKDVLEQLAPPPTVSFNGKQIAWTNTAGTGEDCDDTNPNVHKLNSCGKCAFEPSGKDWSIDDLKDFGSVSSLLQDMLDEVDQFQDLNIEKSLPCFFLSDAYCAGTK